MDRNNLSNFKQLGKISSNAKETKKKNNTGMAIIQKLVYEQKMEKFHQSQLIFLFLD